MERCRQCDPQGSEDSAQRANSSLDRIINQSVRVLTDRLFEHIRVSPSPVCHSANIHFTKLRPNFCRFFQPFFDKLIKRKWLNNTESFEAIEASIKQHFKKFRRMDCPPYEVTYVLIIALDV